MHPRLLTEAYELLFVVLIVGFVICWVWRRSKRAEGETPRPLWRRVVRKTATLTAAAFVLFLALTLLAAIAFERLVYRPAIAISRRVGIVPLVSPREMTQK